MALTIFLVLGPSLMIIIKIVNDNDAAKFVSFAQPVLLTISIALYSTSVSVHKIVERHDHTESEVNDLPESKAPAPLVIGMQQNKQD